MAATGGPARYTPALRAPCRSAEPSRDRSRSPATINPEPRGARMPVTDAPAKARALYDARRTRVPIPPFTDADPTLGMADGYAIQRELVELLLADGDRIVGHKVGLTSKPMQKMVGVDSPEYGPVLASTIYRDGDT